MNLQAVTELFQKPLNFNQQLLAALRLLSFKSQLSHNKELIKDLNCFISRVINYEEENFPTAGPIFTFILTALTAPPFKNEQLILWRAFGNAEVVSTLSKFSAGEKDSKLNLLLASYDCDLQQYIDPKLSLLFEDKPGVQTEEQIASVTLLLTHLGGKENQHRIWSHSVTLTKLMVGHSNKIDYSDLPAIHAFCILLYGVDPDNVTLEYLFGLLDFTIYFNSHTKQTKFTDLLWSRSAYSFWALSLNTDLAVNQSLTQNYKIDNNLKLRFFKLVAFYCLNNIHDKKAVRYTELAANLSDFVSDLSSSGDFAVRVFMFIQKLLNLDLKEAHQVLTTGQTSMVSCLYGHYHRYLMSDTAVCPVLSTIVRIISTNSIKVLAGELEVSCVNSMIADCRKRLADQTQTSKQLELTLRTLQTKQKTDHDKLTKEITDLNQSAKLLQECREQQSQDLEDKLAELEKILNLESNPKSLDAVRLKCIGLYVALASFKIFKSPLYLNYYSRFIFTIYRFIDSALELWLIMLRAKDKSGSMLRRIAPVLHIKQFELSFHHLRVKYTNGDKAMSFSTYTIEDLLIRLGQIVKILTHETFQPLDDEVALVEFINTLAGQFKSQLDYDFSKEAQIAGPKF